MNAPSPRILEVLFSFRVGGSELVGLDLARQLVESGAEVYCAAIDAGPGPLRELCAKYGIRIVDLHIPTRNPLTRNGFSFALARRLKDLKLDAVHFQHFLALNKLGLPARLAGIRRLRNGKSSRASQMAAEQPYANSTALPTHVSFAGRRFGGRANRERLRSLPPSCHLDWDSCKVVNAQTRIS